MYSCTRSTPTLNNTFIRIKSKSSNIPTVVYVYFFTMLYGFGLDFGFKKFLKKKLRVITNWFQFFVTLAIVVLQMLVFIREKYYEYFSYLYLFSYIFHYLVLHRTKYTLCDFIIDIHTLIDNKSIVVTNRVRDGIIYIYTILTIIVKYWSCNLKCILNVDFCQQNSTPTYVNCVPIVVIDGIAIILILISYYVYIPLKYINKSTKDVDTKVLLDNYMYVADCWDKIKPLYTRLVSVFTLQLFFQCLSPIFVFLLSSDLYQCT